MPENEARSIATAISEVKGKARFCTRCFNITDSDLCGICTDEGRDFKKICVVEEPSNILVIERSRVYNGLYHVMLAALSPLDCVKP